jgi:hypothetical protein
VDGQDSLEQRSSVGRLDTAVSKERLDSVVEAVVEAVLVMMASPSLLRGGKWLN